MGKLEQVYTRLLEEATSLVTVNQFLNNWIINLPDLTPDLTRQLGLSGLEISRMMSAIATFRNAKPVGEILQFTPYITGSARTHLGLYVNTTSRIEVNHQLGEIYLPSRVTASYLETTASLANLDKQDGYEFSSSPQDNIEEIRTAFKSLGPRFLSMWDGAMETARSDNPDRLRQAAHSGRELINQSLAFLAPDDSFSQEAIDQFGNDGKITRAMRIRKILGHRSSKARWGVAIEKGIITSVDTLTGISHYRSTEVQLSQNQLISLLVTIGGFLAFCLHSIEIDNNTYDS